MGSGNIKKFELKLGRTGIIITVAGMAALICVSFVLGVTVGKNINTYPEKISSLPQQVLAFFWRPAKVAVNQSQAVDKNAASDKSNMDLTFHNDLTQSKTPSIQPTPAVEKKPESSDVAVESKALATMPPPLERPAEETISKKEETSAPPKAASDSMNAKVKPQKKELSAASAASFMIHVASLKEKSKADHINKSVAEMGYRAKVVKVDIKGKGIWYRVIVPGFETKAQAKTAADKISRKVKTNCLIRQAGMDAEKNP